MNQRVFAIGDIHGCFNQLKEMVERHINLAKTDKLILLGDYIDRGLHSREVIDFIIDLQKSGFDVIALMGNHEAMLLDAIRDLSRLPLWLLNGGLQTMQSFGIRKPDELETEYIDFFSKLPYFYETENALFVHAGFNDKIVDPFEDKYAMLWHSSKKYTNALLKDKVIVHGHSPQKAATLAYNIASERSVINIDSGCVYADKEGYGKLTAIEINSFTITSF